MGGGGGGGGGLILGSEEIRGAAVENGGLEMRNKKRGDGPGLLKLMVDLIIVEKKGPTAATAAEVGAPP